jgi:LmbE family N-acetylglucosaminyl deacetylase
MVSLEEMNLNEGRSLLAIFAHPDDESILAGGTLARHAAMGNCTGLICATRGEWGPISDSMLANYENLGEVRERELRAACEVLGVNWLRFLDLEDGRVSSVLGAEEEIKTLEKIVRAVRELRPQTIITFGPDGLYGHPDHIAIGQLASKARVVACDPGVFPQHLDENLTAHGVPTIFYATVPHGFYTKILTQLAESGHEAHLWAIPPEQFGVPLEEITTFVDIAPFIERKIAALRCHQTQLDDHHAFTHLTRELAAKIFCWEFFRLAANDVPVGGKLL